MPPVELVFLGTVLAYATACALFFAHLGVRGGLPRVARFAPLVLAVAVPLHAAYIGLASIVAHVCPVESLHFVASASSLGAAALYLVLRRRFAIDALGAFVAPAALTAVLGSRFVGVPVHRAGGGLLALHITANVLGDAMFLLAAGAAALYLVQEKQLKKKRARGLLGRLPALDALDRAGHRLLLAGFPLLTLGIITGSVWSQKVESGSAADVARGLFAYATWLLFAAVLVLRAVAGWRGRRAAYGTLAGFAFAVAVLVVYLARAAMTRLS